MKGLRLILIALAVLFAVPSGYAAGKAPSIRYLWSSGRRYLMMSDIANFYGMKLQVKDTTITLSSKYHKAVFNTKRREGSFDGVKVCWFFVPILIDGKYYLSNLDYQNLLDPLVRPGTLRKKPVGTIMLDAGHGGKDKGAPGVTGVQEKSITLAIVLSLRKKLIARGYAVRLTRAGDTFPSLERRVVLWKNASPRPDLFVSIHCNAAKDSSVHGVETFAVTPAGAPSSADAKPEMKAQPGNQFNRYNTRLAYEIQRALLRAEKGMGDRGVKTARFYVIRNVSCPAVLIETGFLSNKAECRRLSTAAGQDRIANAILKGILNYSTQVR